jgi:hypothetical protein
MNKVNEYYDCIDPIDWIFYCTNNKHKISCLYDTNLLCTCDIISGLCLSATESALQNSTRATRSIKLLFEQIKIFGIEYSDRIWIRTSPELRFLFRLKLNYFAACMHTRRISRILYFSFDMDYSLIFNVAGFIFTLIGLDEEHKRRLQLHESHWVQLQLQCRLRRRNLRRRLWIVAFVDVPRTFRSSSWFSFLHFSAS